MEHKYTFLCLQELSTGPSSEPHESSPQPHITFLWDSFYYYPLIDILVRVLLLMLRTLSGQKEP